MRKRKHLLLLGGTVGVAVGITLSLTALGGWRLLSDSSRIPNDWNTVAIRAAEPPNFEFESTSDHLILRYQLINSTLQDFELSSQDTVKAIMMKLNDGSLVGPLGNSACQLAFPIFIPAGQRTGVEVTLRVVIDAQKVGEADDDYHERLRQNLETKYGKIKEFIIYDEARRYQINLPKWLSKKPT